MLRVCDASRDFPLAAAVFGTRTKCKGKMMLRKTIDGIFNQPNKDFSRDTPPIGRQNGTIRIIKVSFVGYAAYS